MDSKVFSKANKILLFALGLVAIMLITVFFVRAFRNKQLLKTELEKNHKEIEIKYDFSTYAGKCYDVASNKAEVKINDLIRISEGDYRKLHISMWDISYLDSEWFDIYYGSKIEYANFLIKTPQDIYNYLSSAVRSNAQIDTIYLSIDPYELYKNYYTSVYYDSEILTFEEYLQNNLFPIFNENKSINFRVILPIKPLSEWANESDDDIVQTFKNWNIFLMYLRYYPNVKSIYMGDEEWLISNDACFNKDGQMTDEIGKLSHLYMYSLNDYIVTPPEIDGALKNVVAMAHRERDGEYDYDGFEEKKIVLSCDSIFNHSQNDCLSLRGCIENLTGAECPEVDEDYTSIDIDANDECIFIIGYGLNAYLKNENPEELSQYILKEIEYLRDKYANSNFLIFTPYRPGVCNGGDEPVSEEGHTLSEYVKVIRQISEDENIPMLDLYKESGITAENAGELLTDEIHPSLNTSLYFSKMIVESMVEQDVCSD